MLRRYYDIKHAKRVEKLYFKKYKLNICTIVPNNYGVNVRSYFEKEWPNISKYVRSIHNNTCEFCGYKQGLHCHEEWRYLDKKKIQYLNSLHAVCALCHATIHPGANHHFQNFESDEVKKHFMTINNMSEDQYFRYINIKLDLALYRAHRNYTIDIVSINNIIEPILNKLSAEIII